MAPVQFGIFPNSWWGSYYMRCYVTILCDQERNHFLHGIAHDHGVQFISVETRMSRIGPHLCMGHKAFCTTCSVGCSIVWKLLLSCSLMVRTPNSWLTLSSSRAALSYIMYQFPLKKAYARDARLDSWIQIQRFVYVEASPDSPWIPPNVRTATYFNCNSSPLPSRFKPSQEFLSTWCGFHSVQALHWHGLIDKCLFFSGIPSVSSPLPVIDRDRYTVYDRNFKQICQTW